jgi:ribonuclease R
MSDDYYEFNEKAHLRKGAHGKRVYRLGDRVQVQVVRVDLERRQIDFALEDVLERAAGRRGSKPGPARPKGPPRGRRPARTRRR